MFITSHTTWLRSTAASMSVTLYACKIPDNADIFWNQLPRHAAHSELLVAPLLSAVDCKLYGQWTYITHLQHILDRWTVVTATVRNDCDQWRRQDLVRGGHKTTGNFLSHIKWREIMGVQGHVAATELLTGQLGRRVADAQTVPRQAARRIWISQGNYDTAEVTFSQLSWTLAVIREWLIRVTFAHSPVHCWSTTAYRADGCAAEKNERQTVSARRHHVFCTTMSAFFYYIGYCLYLDRRRLRLAAIKWSDHRGSWSSRSRRIPFSKMSRRTNTICVFGCVCFWSP